MDDQLLFGVFLFFFGRQRFLGSHVLRCWSFIIHEHMQSYMASAEADGRSASPGSNVNNAFGQQPAVSQRAVGGCLASVIRRRMFPWPWYHSVVQ